MIRVRWFVLLVFILSIAALANAETIQLNNGDKLSGTFEQMIGGNVTFKEDVVGDVTIPNAKIANFRSEKPVWVVLKNKETHTGTLLLKQGRWEIVSNGQTIPLNESDVLAIYPAGKYQANALQGPSKPWLGWTGTGNLGYSLQHSTQRSTSFVAGVAATRNVPNLPGLPPHRQTLFNFSAAFLSVTAPPAPTTSNNTLSASLLENLFFGSNQNDFAFLLAQIDHIQPLQLYLRQTYGGGLGRDLIRHPHMVFSVRGGLTYVRNRFTVPPITQSLEALAGESLTMNLTKRISLTHDFTLYPNLTSAGDYRFDTSTTLNSPISKRFSFQVGFIDHYISAPPPIAGILKNVVIFSVGLGVTFGD